MISVKRQVWVATYAASYALSRAQRMTRDDARHRAIGDAHEAVEEFEDASVNNAGIAAMLASGDES